MTQTSSKACRRRVWREPSIQRAMNPLAIRPGQNRSPLRRLSPSGPVFSSRCVRTGEPDPVGSGRKALLSSWISRTAAICPRREWWSLSGSNRRPPACKAGALPAELKPRSRSPFQALEQMVGPGRFELPTSPLSGVRSNQLSYGPDLLDPGPAEVVVIIQGRKRNVGGDAGHHPNPKGTGHWYARW